MIHVHLRLIVCALLLVVLVPIASATSYKIADVMMIEKGELRHISKEKDIAVYLELTNRDGNDLPVALEKKMKVGHTLWAKPGVNVLLLTEKNSETWLNYDDKATIEEGGELKILGESLHNDKNKEGRSVAGTYSTAIGMGTEYYLNAKEDGSSDVVFVFDGKVLLRHRNGEELLVPKGKAAEATEEGLRFIEMFEPDMKRIKTWRDELNWSTLSWLAKLIYFPIRHPVAAGVVGAATTTYVITEVVIKDDSKLEIEVEMP